MKGILTTDVEFGIDGALYVLDWVASWGGVGKGRMYKFTDPDHANTALQKETEKLIFEGMAKRSGEELAKLLAHPDHARAPGRAIRTRRARRGLGHGSRRGRRRHEGCQPAGAAARDLGPRPAREE